MPSRREFLIGAGAVVAVGAAGAVGMGARRRTSVLHRLGLADSPDGSVPASNTPVVSGTLSSKHVAGPVKWSLSVPPAYCSVSCIACTAAPRGSFGSGFHDDAYWRSIAPAQIATIKQALAPS